MSNSDQNGCSWVNEALQKWWPDGAPEPNVRECNDGTAVLEWTIETVAVRVNAPEKPADWASFSAWSIGTEVPDHWVKILLESHVGWHWLAATLGLLQEMERKGRNER